MYGRYAFLCPRLQSRTYVARLHPLLGCSLARVVAAGLRFARALLRQQAKSHSLPLAFRKGFETLTFDLCPPQCVHTVVHCTQTQEALPKSHVS